MPLVQLLTSPIDRGPSSLYDFLSAQQFGVFGVGPCESLDRLSCAFMSDFVIVRSVDIGSDILQSRPGLRGKSLGAEVSGDFLQLFQQGRQRLRGAQCLSLISVQPRGAALQSGAIAARRLINALDLLLNCGAARLGGLAAVPILSKQVRQLAAFVFVGFVEALLAIGAQFRAANRAECAAVL